MEDHQSIHLVDHTDADNSPTTPPEQPEPLLPTPDSHIDILYENQRGWFVFGIPLFSSKALWNFKVDPSPWVDAKFRPSAVNITNAQVPDPSWVWDWKSWYVDMSLDVDEEGWQYSLLFKGSPWHGNHPWFHSFVRRRRWLRKRVKQKIPPKTKETVRERMFGETFSVGTTLMRTNTPGPASLLNSSKQTSIDEEIRDTATLIRKLKKAAIDREKIVIINRFIDEGGEELHYLAEQVSAPSFTCRARTNSYRYPPSCRCLYFRTRAGNSCPRSWTRSTPQESIVRNTREMASPKAMQRVAESTTSSRQSKRPTPNARSSNTGVISAGSPRKAVLATQQIQQVDGTVRGKALMAVDQNTHLLR
jgi:hypothetical protein